MKKESVIVLESKFRVPNISNNFIVRESLLELLKTEEENIVVLQGKAGYGKTTAMAQYISRNGAVAAWYSFEETDNDKLVFLTHFIYLIKKSFPDINIEQDEFVFLEEMSFEKMARKVIKGLFAGFEAWKQAGKEFLLVFDNFHHIQNAPIQTVIKMILEFMPSDFKMIVSVEKHIPELFSKYIAAGTCKNITENEMEFSKEEINCLIHSMHLDTLAEPKKIEKIYDLTDAWPVAVLFLLRYVRQTGSEIENFTREQFIQETMIKEYIQCEIYQKLGAPIQQFLVKTSVFEEFDLELCKAVLEIPDVKHIFGEVLRGHLCLRARTRSIQEGCHCRNGTYQYKPLLRQFFNELLHQEEEQNLLNRTAEFYFTQAQFHQAAQYAKKTKNFPLIVQMLEKQGQFFIREKDLAFLDEWIPYLIQKEYELSAKALGVIAEYYYVKEEYDKLELYFNLADSMFGKENQYGMYRSLYKGLLKYSEDCLKYEKQINNALFFLKENQLSLPFLKEEEKFVLEHVRKQQSEEAKKRVGKKLFASMFGTFRIVVMEDEKELSWRTRKGCELFAYLIDLQGKPVERKKLLQELWKEEIPNNAVAMLHNMFYNIRKELSYYNMDDLIQYKNKKYSLDTELLHSDLDEITALCERIEQKDITALPKSIPLFRTYWGRYLEDIDSEWVREKQEYYEKMYVKGCMMIAEELIKEKAYEEALVYLKNALGVSIYSDELVMSIIYCYGEMGDLKGVKRQYEEFCMLLEKELDIAPGEELKRIYKQSISRNKECSISKAGL